MTESPIQQYIHLLDVRKRWAKIGIVALGAALSVSLIAALGWLWTTRYRPITGSTALLVVVLCVYPVFGLISQLFAHRRINETLELLDVIEREYGARPTEGQQAERYEPR